MVEVHRGTGDDHDGNVACAGMSRDLLMDDQPIEVGQYKIKDHEVRWVLVKTSKCVDSVCSFFYPEANEQKRASVHPAEVMVILDNENCVGGHRGAF